jgi:rhodanese-related sulfurtransferase
MRKIWLACLVGLAAGVFLAAAGTSGATEKVPRMAADELKARLGSPSLVLLDVRIPSDWEGSDMKIAGALREDPGKTEVWAGKYSKEKTLVLYCQ